MMRERPWRLSLDDVKDYFGEKIALYFGFVGHLTAWLGVLAVVGLLILGVMVWRWRATGGWQSSPRSRTRSSRRSGRRALLAGGSAASSASRCAGACLEFEEHEVPAAAGT